MFHPMRIYGILLLMTFRGIFIDDFWRHIYPKILSKRFPWKGNFRRIVIISHGLYTHGLTDHGQLKDSSWRLNFLPKY